MNHTNKGIELGELISALRARGVAVVAGASGSAVAGVRVRGVVQHSGLVGPGALFAALGGTRVDGAAYIAEARDRGAVAVICVADADDCGLPSLRVTDVARATGHAASIVAGEPSAAMSVVAITGTNGKTSTAYVLESILAAGGRRVGVLGTIVQRWPGVERESKLTTPSACEVQAVLAEMRDAGVDSVVMEVSSHALIQQRVAGCRFAVGVFTNLTRDHFDYHQGEDAYFEAKALLIREYIEPNGATAVLNLDDPRVAGLVNELGRADVWTFSTHPAANARVSVRVADAGLRGMELKIELDGNTIGVHTQLVGEVNAANIAAAVAAAAALGVAPEQLAQGIRDCRPVPGRLERIGLGDPAVLVDYAHTPDALERAIASLRPFVAGRLIVAFGCGGDRDRGKRPLMGAAAARLADVVVVTSDNPRSEDPEAIIEGIVAEVSAGLTLRDADELAGGARGYIRKTDRREAIELSMAIAAKGDAVLIAGKGHENYQEINGVRHDLDDRAIVAALQQQVRGRT